MTDRTRARVALLEAEITHWRHASDVLGDLESIASAAAWAGLEQYLSVEIRRRLQAVVSSLQVDGAAVAASLRDGVSPAHVRTQVLRLRQRYLQAETILDFYGDAINTRTVAELAAVLRGLDRLAGDALDVTLRPFGIAPPPVLVYLDKGLGASVLRAGIRLWDESNPSPAAAIKVTRHNLASPTALLHEVGHQFAHLTGWTIELAATFESLLAPVSRELATVWSGWASEVAADTYAFALSGWAPLSPLANVVDGNTRSVYRMIPGDPHPFPMIRVLFNAVDMPQLVWAWPLGRPGDRMARTSSSVDHRRPRRRSDAAFDVVDGGHRRHLHTPADGRVPGPVVGIGGRPHARRARRTRRAGQTSRWIALDIAIPGAPRIDAHPGVADDATARRPGLRRRSPPQPAHMARMVRCRGRPESRLRKGTIRCP